MIILANTEVPINGRGYSSTRYVDDDIIKLSVEPFRLGNNIHFSLLNYKSIAKIQL